MVIELFMAYRALGSFSLMARSTVISPLVLSLTILVGGADHIV